MGKKIAVNIETLINKGFPIQKSKIIFKEILNSIENTHYSENLEKMFNYAIDNDPSLFTNISFIFSIVSSFLKLLGWYTSILFFNKL